MERQLKKMLVLFFVLLIAFNVSAKTYKIAYADDYYPYIFTNADGGLAGLMVDVWNLWSEKAGLEIEFVQTDIQSSLDKINSGEIDILAGLYYTEDRASFLDFSDPILRLKTVLFLKNGLNPNSIEELDAVIYVVENTVAKNYLESEYPNLKLKTFKSHSTIMAAVSKETINAFTYELHNPIGDFKEQNPPKGFYSYKTLFSDRLRPAVKKGNNELLALIMAGSSKITDEELFQIAEKWDLFEKDKSMLIWILFIGFALAVSVAIVIIYFLKHQQKIKKITDYQSKTDWQVIIEKGENDFIEFKSSLRWDYRQEKVNKILEQVIVKTISAFLNTEGGMLFIGVDDAGNVLGLDNDYNCLSKKSSDGFLLTLTNLVSQTLGKSTHKFVKINIITINEKDVCIISAEKSDKPVFIVKGDKEEFYIRASASSQPLGMSETFKYIGSHWK